MRDKLQEIIKDAQEDTYSDSPRFVDAILELLAPELEKAQKYDAIVEVTPKKCVPDFDVCSYSKCEGVCYRVREIISGKEGK